jgi:hypothetical protein
VIPVVLSSLALVGAILAVTIAVAVARQSGAVASTLDRHRNAHVARDGTADPQPGGHRADRRRVDLGPSRTAGERLQSPSEPPEDAPGPESLETSPQAVLGAEEPPTVAARAVRLPRPGEIGRQR